MIARAANYLRGAVRIKISGAMPEKFINLCVCQNIALWGITRNQACLVGWMHVDDFFIIREIARKSRTRVTIVRRYGLPFTAKRFKKRRILIAGPVLFFLVFNILSSYIWFVDITGLKHLPDERVRAIAAQHGLQPGAAKNNINTKRIASEILIGLPEVAWTGVNLTGTRAVIEVVEKTMPRQDDKSPAHLIAAKDGVITEMIVLAGQTVLKQGDTVKKGDVLIRGVAYQAPERPAGSDNPVQPAPPPEQFIRAKGIVKARVWYESYGETRLETAIHEKTGRQQMGVMIRIGSNNIIFKQAAPDQFSLYECQSIQKKLPLWRNQDLIVESNIDIYHELDTKWLSIGVDEARDLAKSKALDDIQMLIPQTARILSRTVEVIETSEPNLVRVKAAIEAEEEIGQSMTISQ